MYSIYVCNVFSTSFWFRQHGWCRLLALCALNFKEKLPWPVWQISICKPTATFNVELTSFNSSRTANSIQHTVYSPNKKAALLALCAADAGLMDIWPLCVCVKCVYTVCIYSTWWWCICRAFQGCVCACLSFQFLAEDGEFWAFAMLSQQGARATLEGTDGLNSLSPWFTIQTDRERNKEPETQSTTERFNHWNGEEKTL